MTVYAVIMQRGTPFDACSQCRGLMEPEQQVDPETMLVQFGYQRLYKSDNYIV